MSNQLTGSGGPLIVRDLSGGFGNQPRGYLDFTATVNVADPAGLVDSTLAMLSVDATGRLRVVLGGPSPSGTIGVVPSVLSNSLAVTTRVVAPGAAAVIATIAAPAAGTYDAQVMVGLDGAVAAAELNNMEFRRGATVVCSLPVPVLANVIFPVRTIRIVLDGSTAVSVNATGAGTAGIGYTANITLIRVA